MDTLAAAGAQLFRQNKGGISLGPGDVRQRQPLGVAQGAAVVINRHNLRKARRHGCSEKAATAVAFQKSVALRGHRLRDELAKRLAQIMVGLEKAAGRDGGIAQGVMARNRLRGPQAGKLDVNRLPSQKADADINQLATAHAAKTNFAVLGVDRDPVAVMVGMRAGNHRQNGGLLHFADAQKSFPHLLLLEPAFFFIAHVLILAAAALPIVWARRRLALSAGRKDLHDLSAGVVRFALGDPNFDAFAFRRKRDEQDEVLAGAGEAISAEDNLFDRQVDDITDGEGAGRRGRLGRNDERKLSARADEARSG